MVNAKRSIPNLELDLLRTFVAVVEGNSFAAAAESVGNDSNLLIVFYVQIMPDDFVMQLHRF